MCAMRRLLLTLPLAEMYTKRKVRAILNSAPGRIKGRQRWSVSQHRRANLLLVLVNDKPPFNRRLCVKNFFFPPRLPSLPSLALRISKQSGNVALPSSCGAFCAFSIWPETESQVGVALYAAVLEVVVAATEGRWSMRQQQWSGQVRTRSSGGCGSLCGKGRTFDPAGPRLAPVKRNQTRERGGERRRGGRETLTDKR